MKVRTLPHKGSSDGMAKGRTVVAVSILLLIALIHLFRAGSYLHGSLYALYYSYFSDIVVPFGIYFLLDLDNVRVRYLEDWRVRAILVFAVASSTELLQALGVPLLGQTFDPLDFVMFGAGVLLAAFADKSLFARLLACWSPTTEYPSDVSR
jgi:hypothetical protein